MLTTEKSGTSLLTMACGTTYYGAPDEAKLRLAVLLLDGQHHAALLVRVRVRARVRVKGER